LRFVAKFSKEYCAKDNCECFDIGRLLNFRYFDSGHCRHPIVERTFPKVSIVFSPDQMPSKIE